MAVEGSLPIWGGPQTQIPEDTESGTTWHSYPFDIFTEQAATSVIFKM